MPPPQCEGLDWRAFDRAAAEGLFGNGRILRRHELRPRPADQLVGRVSSDALAGLAAEGERTAGVDRPDPVPRRLDKGAIASLADAQADLCCLPTSTLVGGVDRPSDRCRQTREIALQHVIGRAAGQRPHRCLFAHRPGYEDERQEEITGTHRAQGAQPVERRQSVVRQHDVERCFLEGVGERLTAVDAYDLAGHAGARQRSFDEVGVRL
jgi:hypothetical protein